MKKVPEFFEDVLSIKVKKIMKELKEDREDGELSVENQIFQLNRISAMVKTIGIYAKGYITYDEALKMIWEE